MGRMNLHFIIFFVICGANTVLGRKYAVLAVDSPSMKENFCISYFPQFSSLPSQKSKAISHIPRYTRFNFCDTEPSANYNQSIVLLSPSNCSLASQARVLQEHGAAGVLFITEGNENIHFDTDDPTEGVNISVGLISENSATQLRYLADSTVCMFAPERRNFDLSFLVIWVVAMFAVTVGGYWSGVVRHSLYIHERDRVPIPEGDANTSERVEEIQVPNNQQYPYEDSSFNITPCQVVVFVICMGTALLLLYFFFKYLVYVLIGLFVLATINSTYVCTYPVLMKILPNSFNLFQCHCGGKIRMIDYRHIILFAISISLPVAWVVTRNERYSWVLQDILGVLFCISLLRTIRLPNLKICTFFLVLLFFYDIFFVFITPFMTAKGESVMEQVAVGTKSEEKLPMMLRVPRLTWDALTVCYTNFSGLGFGDILAPGLLISYCHGFDLIVNSKRIYFLTVVISYGLGMILTFGGLLLMETAQPALLYLVPATLIPPIVLAWNRKEFLFMWNGVKKENVTENDVHNTTPENKTENIESFGTVNENQSSFFDSGGLPVSDTPNPINNEQKLLIPDSRG